MDDTAEEVEVLPEDNPAGVEAMSSHRPYRAGLGLDVALAELGAQRGSLFDPRVVDACIALLREQHYKFKERGG